MDHETVANLVSDWAAGRLSAEEAGAVESHIRGCDECRDASEIARAVSREIGTHGASLFSPHPSPEELSRFVLEPDRLTLPALATIGGHVRACPTCESDSALVRRAGELSLGRRLAAWLAVHRSPAALLQPALAALTLALIYPAYVGIVEYPRARDQAHRLAPPAVRSAPAAPQASWSGGGVDPLVLASAQRGSASSLPTLRLRSGQPAQPIFIDREPPPGATRLGVILRDGSGAIAWRLEAPVADLWNPRARLIALLVPADRLHPGEYRIELVADQHGAPLFAAGFRVLATPER